MSNNIKLETLYLNNSMMNDKLIKQYQNRLHELDKTILSLHEIAETQQSLIILREDQNLLKFRIERVNQIVYDVINSEKQKIIICLLEKCALIQGEKLNEKNNFVSDSKSENKQNKEDLFYYKKMTENKIQQYKKLQKDFLVCSEQNLKSKMQIQNLKQNSIKTISQINELKKSVQYQTTENQKLMKQLKESKEYSKLLKDENLKLNEKLMTTMEQQQKQSNSLKAVNQLLEMEIMRIKNDKKQEIEHQQTIKQRNQKIDKLKKEIYKLNQQMQDIMQVLDQIKTVVKQRILQETKKFKRYYSDYRKKIELDLQRMKQNLIQKTDCIKNVILKVQQKQSNFQLFPCYDKFERRLNEIDNQMDYFIENQILNDQF